MSTISKALPTPPDNFSTQLAASVSSTDTTIQLDSTSGLPTEGVGQLFKKNADGEVVAGSVEFVHWTSVSGNSLVLSDVGDRGITGSDSGAQAYAADDYFEVWVSSYYNLRDAFDEEHNADGTHASTIVKTTATQTLTNKTLTSPTINSPTMTSTTTDDIQVTGEAYFDAEVDNGNSGTAKTIDWTAGNKQKITLTGNCTFTFTAPSGPANLILRLIQDGTGSKTVTWPATVKWPEGTAPTLSTAASSVDIVSFYWDGTNYHGQASLAFAVPA